MQKLFDSDDKKRKEDRLKILGLGKKSHKKSYYPQLQKRIKELELFKAAIDHAGDALFIVKIPSGEILECNSSAQAIVGKSDKEKVCLPELLDKEGLKGWQQGLDSGISSDKRAYRGAFRSISDEKEVPVELSVGLYTQSPHPLAVVIARDISRQLEIEKQLMETHEELKRNLIEISNLNRNLKAFDYSVSNALKVPIRHIEGFATILKGDADDELVDSIVRATGDARELINALLRLSRVSRQKIDLDDVDLAILARSNISKLLENRPERNIAVEIEETMPVRASLALMNFVMEILFDNAIKFTTHCDKAKITFHSIKEGETTVYCLEDNGIGFDDSVAVKLFQPFEHLHADPAFKGLGLGLATAEQVINRHKGRIWARSEPGKGSKFFFTLWEKSG